jgi:class 3 adenylate cyclase
MSSSAHPPTETTAPAGERRQVTALFADMVGYTSISATLGEEGTFALIQPIYQLMAGAVEELGGTVNEFTGDGIMALFGAPNALEDAPLRACRAGLLIHERIAAIAPALADRHGFTPRMRIGINSGLAVVTHIRGDGSALTAVGDTVNLASRLQALAEPGAVLLSEATHALVEGLVEARFVGPQAVKGKAEPQKLYSLEAIRPGATRFKAALGRGLTPHVGRERESAVLERGLVEAGERLRVIDVVAEPGMGKSRLLHEFDRRFGENGFVLSGSCSPDGRQTPFLPFIEGIRRAFQVEIGEAEREVARKLESGLDALGMRSDEHVGLLLNLLGLEPPAGSLAGLDGVLIGLRTRDLLHRLLEARCRQSTVVVLIEDLHWIDSVSEEVLGEMVGGSPTRRLLVIHTRRPDYEPAWLGRPSVTTLRLEPLAAPEVRRLVQARLNADALPSAFARLVTEKADGNALFAEEIVSLLSERGVLRAKGGNVEFDLDAQAAALPASVEGILRARVDRLAPQDRELLQAAAAIGRQFDTRSLAAAATFSGDIGARLAAMQASDVVYADAASDGYAFKHALMRDALYQSLLTRPRQALHLRIAEEIERRSGNRPAEVCEALAHHFSQTDRAEKAFVYLAMAGAKSLGVYSLDEADRYFAAAMALVDKEPSCASDRQVADLLVNYVHSSHISLRLKTIIDVVERSRPRLDRLGDSPQRILIQHHYVTTLIWSARHREAQKAQSDLVAMAERMRDAKSTAYALASGISVSTHVAPMPLEAFEAQRRKVFRDPASLDDRYLQNFVLAAVGWDQLNRGRIPQALEAAEELMAAGRRLNDPRSMGYALALRSLAALLSDDYQTALELAEMSMSISRAPFERETAASARNTALLLLRRPEAPSALAEFMSRCAANGWNLLQTGPDDLWGVTLIMKGEIGAGIRYMEEAIRRRESEGYQASADWTRMFLCEVYLEILSGAEKLPLGVRVRNLWTLIVATLTAERRILALIARVRQNPQFDPAGHYVGRCEMIVGLLHKAKGKRAPAIRRLEEARRIASQSGRTPMLARIDTALAELG